MFFRPRFVARLTNAGQRTGRLAVLATRAHAALYRRTVGRFFPRWFGAPVAALETVGRRSGRPRSTPVVAVPDGESFVVFAAAGGARTPAWWLNLRAAAVGTLVVGRDRIRVRPRVPEGSERERLWERYLAAYPPAEEYRHMGDHDMPLVLLERT